MKLSTITSVLRRVLGRRGAAERRTGDPAATREEQWWMWLSMMPPTDPRSRS